MKKQEEEMNKYQQMHDYIYQEDGISILKDNIKDMVSANIANTVADRMKAIKKMNPEELNQITNENAAIISVTHLSATGWETCVGCGKKHDLAGLQGSSLFIENGFGDLKDAEVRDKTWRNILALIMLSRLRALHPDFVGAITFVTPMVAADIANMEKLDSVKSLLKLGITKKDMQKKLNNHIVVNIALADNTRNIIRGHLNYKDNKFTYQETFNPSSKLSKEQGYMEHIPLKAGEGFGYNSMFFALNSMDVTKLRRKILALPNGDELLALNQNMYAKMGLDIIAEGAAIGDNEHGEGFKEFFTEWYNKTNN